MVGDIYTYVDEHLATLGIPYFMGGYETDEFPEQWIEYTVTKRPSLMADDEEQETQHTISLIVYTPRADPQLYQSIELLFADCAPKGGGYVGELDVYPPKKMYALDFAI